MKKNLSQSELELAGKIKGTIGPEGARLADLEETFDVTYLKVWQVVSSLCKKKELVKKRVVGTGWHFRFFLPEDYKPNCCPTCGKEMK